MRRSRSARVLRAVAAAAGLFGPGVAAAQTDPIEAALVHPPVAARFQCSEHALGAEDHVPDALGADCVVVRRTGGPDGNLNSLYSGDGSRNEHWHGWREPLLAPCDGRVVIVSINPETTQPGSFGPGRSSAILFRCGPDDEPDPVQVALIHVREVVVAEGDRVSAGDVVARIGNNGSSFNPHVHIGAFRGELFSEDAIPLQIRIDLAAMGHGSGDPGGRVAQPTTSYAWVIFGSDTVRAEIARTNEERERGLMFRESVPDGTGMLFVFQHAETQGVWMKDTYVPLDVAFLDAESRILNIEQLEPQDLTPKWSQGPVMFALEVRQGWFADHHVSVGDRAEIVFGVR